MDSIDYYDRYAIPYFEKTVDLSMEEMLKPFIELLPENAEVLDLGCGSGRDNLYMEEEGISVTPMDASAEMCKLASIHTGKEVLNLRLEDMDFDDVFDGVWACAVIGHFTPKEVKKAMKKVIRSLKEGGIMYFSVRKGDRDGQYNGRYFCDYSKRTLEDLVESLRNVELMDIWITEDIRKESEGNEWFNVLLRKTE